MTTGRHGTYADYVHGCRCEQCKAASAEYQRARRAGQRGTPPLADRFGACVKGEEVGDTDWMANGICEPDDGELFFPPINREASGRRFMRPQGGTARPAIFYSPEAVALCAICPAQVDCLDYALRFEVDGIWAATTPAERTLIRRAQGITAQQLATIPDILTPPDTNPDHELDQDEVDDHEGAA